MKHMKKPLWLLIAVTLALLASSLSVVPAAAMGSTAADVKIAWPGDQANKAVYWEQYLEMNYQGDWTCEKVDKPGSFTTSRAYDAIVVKAGQWNYLWKPAPIGLYTTPQDVSHWFKCNQDKPEHPMPKLSVNVSCVAWADGGPLNTVRVVSAYNTYGRELTLVQNITIETATKGVKTINNQSVVNGEGSKVSTKFAGRGTHHVFGYVKLGYKLKKHVDEYVTCAPVVNRLKAGFGSTKGDPWERAWVSNRMNTTAQKAVWTYKARDGWTSKKVTIPAGCRWNWGWNWVQGGTTMKIEWIKPNGARVVIAEKQVPPPGYYGKIPPTYRGYICP